MTDGCSTYRDDKYYWNKMVNSNAWHRKERIVPKWKFFLIKAFSKNRYNIYGENKNVLYEKGGKLPDVDNGKRK